MCGWVPHASSIRDAAPTRSAVTLGCSSSPWPLFVVAYSRVSCHSVLWGCVILGNTTGKSVVGKRKTLRQIMINPGERK
jgi:hypothetical protein